MKLSRRALLAATVAGTTAVAAGVTLKASAAETAAPAATFSPEGDIIGKVSVGYQGWFGAIGDGGRLGWWHNGKDWGKAPSPDNKTLWAWPDMTDFEHKYRTGYANLGNGEPATLFSSLDEQTVDTHFRWMRDYNIDTAALQRFNPTGAEGAPRDLVTGHVRAAAEKYDRKFYIMYDVSDWTNMQAETKTDWTTKMKAYTASPAYAKQNGKPVVAIWGFGFGDGHHAFSQDVCIDVITWFQEQGCYVIGGVPTHWREGVEDSYPNYQNVYHTFDCLTPWMVTRIGSDQDSDQFYTWLTKPDVEDCLAHGVDYQAGVIPGDLNQHKRRHGDFMWHQFYNVTRAGSPAVYVAMFDEFNESNQIAKTAESPASAPTDGRLVCLDEDGTKCTSDYYMRLTGDGGRMLKGEIALTATRPTPPWID